MMKEERLGRRRHDDDDDDLDDASEINSVDDQSMGSFNTHCTDHEGEERGVPGKPTLGEFFQNTLNNGTGDGVVCFKLLVLGVLVIAALVIGNAAFVFTTHEINDDYKSEFNTYANELLTESEARAASIFESMTSLSNNIVSHSLSTGSEWPFVTVTDFEARHKDFLELSGSDSVALLPLVEHKHRESFENYTVHNQEWIKEGLSFRGATINNDAIAITPYFHVNQYSRGGPETGAKPLPVAAETYYTPYWQIAPSPTDADVVNYDALESETFYAAFDWMQSTKQPTLSQIIPIEDEIKNIDDEEPHSYLLQPMYQNFFPTSPLVGILVVNLEWRQFFVNLLPDVALGIVIELSSSCAPTYSYEVNGPNVVFLGEGELHDLNYANLKESAPFSPLPQINGTASFCDYTVTVFPSENFRKVYDSNDPLIYTAAVILIFFMTLVLFVVYDCCVERREENITKTAARSNALVSSLFPEQVRDRLLDDANEPEKKKGIGTINFDAATIGEEQAPTVPNSKPIADLFPSTTIMFADIAGFTAWSSVREPAQVFILLETIYNAFDAIANRRGVFKVETVGDSYVAVCGLPRPRKDHAVVMARFAYNCMEQMDELVVKLELSLGPGTRDLAMRYGLHSGPVTGGVLRGEKSRFQLFGDTMNTAARMESTGSRGKVQLSQETADLLIAAGKSRWLKPREDLVVAKGKGEMRTYWLDFKSRDAIGPKVDLDVDDDAFDGVSSTIKRRRPRGKSKNEEEPMMDNMNVKTRSLVDWNVDLLLRSIKKIVAMRDDDTVVNAEPEVIPTRHDGTTVMDEVKEIITLPSEAAAYKRDPDTVQLSKEVEDQLRNFVSTIATMYRENPFHCFEHASHVTMSSSKLLSRIVTPSDIDYNAMSYKEHSHDKLHEYTYGITSDPLTQFAMIFSALIHDVDHSGVPNAQLVKEKSRIAEIYKNKSVAEQNSVDLAWELLMDSSFKELRQCIYINEAERQRFRQLVVNAVLATDIADKELGALRKQRWDKAFSGETTSDVREDTNRKATIVIEHLIQASDVAHTMQHWHIYQKWNEKLFTEIYLAYRAGRAEKDPSDGWYKGELWFFDNYIIPLAKKLESCGVFGVASDEYLNYAVANRREWESKGAELVERYRTKAMIAYKMVNQDSFRDIETP